MIHFIVEKFMDIHNLDVVLKSLFEDSTFKCDITVHAVEEYYNYLIDNLKFDFSEGEITITKDPYTSGYLIPTTAIFLINTFKLLEPFTTPLDASHPAVIQMTEEMFRQITDNVFDFTQQKIILFTMPEEFEGYTQMLMNITFGHLYNFLHPVDQTLIEEESF